MKRHYGTLAACVFVAATASKGAVIYVDGNATDTPHDGSTWCNAYLDLQSALAFASAGDEIRVADGTYKPTGGSSRDATFELISGVAVRGGYAGCGAPDPDDRDWFVYETILSGDLSGNDGPNFTYRSDNSYHVVRISGTGNSAVLEGFVISGGNATGTGDNRDIGGGILNVSDGEPTITNCAIRDNQAKYGGGMHSGGTKLTLEDCIFEVNRARVDGGGVLFATVNQDIEVLRCDFIANQANTDPEAQGPKGGGGLWVGDGEYTFTMTWCNLFSNTAMHGGGGYTNGSDADFILCRFTENLARPQGGTGLGGGLYGRLVYHYIEQEGNPVYVPTVFRFVNTLFLRNEAKDEGGAIWFDDCLTSGAAPEISFCTFVENKADLRGGGILRHTHIPEITSTIFWNNIDACFECNPPGCTCDEGIYTAQIHTELCSGGSLPDDPVIGYSDIQGLPGISNGNINYDPRFYDPNGCDSDPQNDFHLSHWSPCVDAANSAPLSQGFTEDLDHRPRKVDDAGTLNAGTGSPAYVDMGVYEWPGPPFVIQGRDGVSFDQHAFSEYIDPRAERIIDPQTQQPVDVGLDHVFMLFSEEVRDVAGQSLSTGAFSVSSTGGNPPAVECIDAQLVYVPDQPDWPQRYLVLVQFDGFIELEEWTTIEADVEDTSGVRIETPALDFCPGCTTSDAETRYRPNRIDVGALPADVNQSTSVEPFDVLVFRQYLLGVSTPEQGVVRDYLDIDRNLIIHPFDLLGLRRLINGVEPATQEWANVTLPAGPPPCVTE